jgi:predicted transcriptional regulator
MQLTAPELEIHKALWQQQAQSGKRIHDRLAELYGWSYSSTRKTLERMCDKGTVQFQVVGNKKIYSTKLEKIATLAAYAEDFAKRVLEINGPVPMTLFSESQLLEKEELNELEKLLNQSNTSKD